MCCWQGWACKSSELANSLSSFQLVPLWFFRSCQEQKVPRDPGKSGQGPLMQCLAGGQLFSLSHQDPPASTAVLHKRWCNCARRSCTFRFCSTTFNTAWRPTSIPKPVNQNFYINNCLLYISNCLEYLGGIY